MVKMGGCFAGQRTVLQKDSLHINCRLVGNRLWCRTKLNAPISHTNHQACPSEKVANMSEVVIATASKTEDVWFLRRSVLSSARGMAMSMLRRLFCPTRNAAPIIIVICCWSKYGRCNMGQFKAMLMCMSSRRKQLLRVSYEYLYLIYYYLLLYIWYLMI